MGPTNEETHVGFGRVIIAAGLAAAVALTPYGYASVNKNISGYDLSRIDP